MGQDRDRDRTETETDEGRTDPNWPKGKKCSKYMEIGGKILEILLNL
jgi:hypothetical protein